MKQWEGDLIAPRQKTAIATVINGQGITDRGDRLALLSYILDTPVTTMNELTKGEGARVLDALGRIIAEGDLTLALELARTTPCGCCKGRVDVEIVDGAPVCRSCLALGRTAA